MSIMLESMRPTPTKKAGFKGMRNAMRNALKKPLFHSFFNAMRNALNHACGSMRFHAVKVWKTRG